MNTCIYMNIHIYTNTCTKLYTYIYRFSSTCIYTNISYLYVDNYMCTYTCIYIIFKLQHTATHACNTLLRTHLLSCVWTFRSSSSKYTHFVCSYWNTLQHTHLFQMFTLQHITTHCNTHAYFICSNISIEQIRSNLVPAGRENSFMSHVITCSCVAVCCSVLQCVAMCCSVLQCVAVCCSVFQRVAVR